MVAGCCAPSCIRPRPARDLGACPPPAQCLATCCGITSHRPPCGGLARCSSTPVGPGLVIHRRLQRRDSNQALEFGCCSPPIRNWCWAPCSGRLDHGPGSEGDPGSARQRAGTPASLGAFWVRNRRWLAAGWAGASCVLADQAEGRPRWRPGWAAAASSRSGAERWRLQQGRPRRRPRSKDDLQSFELGGLAGARSVSTRAATWARKPGQARHPLRRGVKTTAQTALVSGAPTRLRPLQGWPLRTRKPASPTPTANGPGGSTLLPRPGCQARADQQRAGFRLRPWSARQAALDAERLLGGEPSARAIHARKIRWRIRFQPGSSAPPGGCRKLPPPLDPESAARWPPPGVPAVGARC